MSMQSEYSTAGLKTELTLGLPGGGGCELAGSKRRFNDTVVGANLGDEASDSTTKPSPPKAQVVGWAPVRPFRRNMMKRSKYVKVAVDGAPVLRKVDLEVYSSYEDLLAALENMFTCFTICNVLNERKIMDPSDGTEYLPSYEDKDGDWMLVGDVPWKLFVESCKRLRLKKSSEANDLAPRACSSESSTS